MNAEKHPADPNALHNSLPPGSPLPDRRVGRRRLLQVAVIGSGTAVLAVVLAPAGEHTSKPASASQQPEATSAPARTPEVGVPPAPEARQLTPEALQASRLTAQAFETAAIVLRDDKRSLIANGASAYNSAAATYTNGGANLKNEDFNPGTYTGRYAYIEINTDGRAFMTLADCDGRGNYDKLTASCTLYPDSNAVNVIKSHDEALNPAAFTAAFAEDTLNNDGGLVIDSLAWDRHDHGRKLSGGVATLLSAPSGQSPLDVQATPGFGTDAMSAAEQLNAYQRTLDVLMA